MTPLRVVMLIPTLLVVGLVIDMWPVAREKASTGLWLGLIALLVGAVVCYVGAWVHARPTHHRGFRQ
jgi:uncharacterized membrane protein YczE